MVTIHYDYKCVDTCCDSTDILLFTAIACLKSEYNEEKCLLLNTTIECSFGLLWLIGQRVLSQDSWVKKAQLSAANQQCWKPWECCCFFCVSLKKWKGDMLFLKIDNMAVLLGWYRGYVKTDKSASEVLKGVHYLSGLLGTTVHVEHVDRISTDMAQLADELSRMKFSKKRLSCSGPEWGRVQACWGLFGELAEGSMRKDGFK